MKININIRKEVVFVVKKFFGQTALLIVVFAVCMFLLTMEVNIQTVEGANQSTSMDMISVKDHGLIGDGFTDDSSAFRTLLSGLSTGESIYFPDGTYLWGSEVEITVSGVRIVFEKNAKIVNNTSINSIFKITDDDITIENAKFEGSATTSKALYILGQLNDRLSNIKILNSSFDGIKNSNIYADYVNDITIQNVDFSNANIDGAEGIIYCKNADNAIVNNIRISDSYYKGIAAFYSNNVLLKNIIINNLSEHTVGAGTGLGIDIGYNCNHVNISNYISTMNDEAALRVSRNSKDINIENCYFENLESNSSTDSAVILMGCKNVNLNNSIVNTITARGIYIADWDGGYDVENIKIEGNIVKSANSYGIYALGAKNVDIIGNSMKNTYIRIHWSSHVNIISNTIRSSEYYDSNIGGIYIYKSTAVNAMSNNISNTNNGGTWYHGIYATSSLSNILIGNNNISLDSTTAGTNGIFISYGDDIKVVNNIVDALNDFGTNSVTNCEIIRIKIFGGNSQSRPSSPYLYECYFDATLGYPLWWDGSNWIDSSGTSH